MNAQLIGLALLPFISGCIFVPNFGPDSHAISDRVGIAGSKKPLRIGQSTRDNAIAVLGMPYFRTQHNLAIGYVHYRTVGYWFPFGPGPCGLAGGGPAIQDELLYLEFDSSGILRRKELNDPDVGWPGFIKIVPDTDATRNDSSYPKPPY